MSEEAEKLIQQNAKEIDSHDEQMAKRRSKKKIKATIYLTEEAEQAFTELYIHRLRKDRKIDRSIHCLRCYHGFIRERMLQAKLKKWFVKKY